jgi:hypothetical protein
MAKMSIWHAQIKPLIAPIAHQPGPGGYQGTSTSQLVGSVVLGGTAAPAVPPARDLDFFISNSASAVFGPWASGTVPGAVTLESAPCAGPGLGPNFCSKRCYSARVGAIDIGAIVLNYHGSSISFKSHFLVRRGGKGAGAGAGRARPPPNQVAL